MMKRLYAWMFVCLLLLGVGRLAAQTETECPPPPVGFDVPPYTYYIGVGDAYTDRQQFALAVTAYTCAIDAQPDFASGYARRGYAHTALADSEAALADFNRALDLDESLLEAYINRGILYTRVGNYGLAIGDFTLVLSFDPQNSIGLQNRAMVHAIEGNYDQALADLEQAIAVVPDDPAPYAARAAIYSALAMADYQRFLETSGDPRASLPAGTPVEVLLAVDNDLRTGSIAVWTSLLRAGV
jgi:tetratricopeptide (TPR) repeat protein